MTSTTSDLIDRAIWDLPFDTKIKVWELIEQLVKESQLPKQEISDEEIEKEIKSRYETPHNNSGFMEGAKWYREQLKLKQPKKD